jgi:hypothetical protein
MRTHERFDAPPFLKLSATGLTSCRCTHHRLERINAFCFMPISLLYRFVSSVSPKPRAIRSCRARLAQENPDAPAVKARADRAEIKCWGTV